MEPIDWLVDKILPVGLSILGAPSKYYKSYMALGLCVVGQGSGHWEGRSEEIKNASKYLSQEIYEDVRNIGKFIREYSDLLQGIDGVNAIPGNTKTRKWKFNDTNATNNIDATNDTNATQMKLRYQG